MFDNNNATSLNFYEKKKKHFLFYCFTTKYDIGKEITVSETIYTKNNKKWNNISLFEL